MDQTFLVESLRYVKEYGRRDFDKVTDDQMLEVLRDHKYGFQLIKIIDYSLRTGDHCLSHPKRKDLVIFLTPGSHGDIKQMPATFNTVFNHTMLLNSLDKDQCMVLAGAYTFDFKGMPSAFSRIMLIEEAKFIEYAVKYVMEHE